MFGIQNVEVGTVRDDRESPDVKLAELDVPKVQVVWVVCEDRESVGHEIVVLIPSKKSTTKCEP